MSVCVHAFPSLHAAPLAALGFVHTPVVVLQVPATWHWSSAEQITGLAPVHAPAWQVSDCVQAFPSSQAVPLASVVWTQPVAGLQLSAVQGLPSSHEMLALEQAPPAQVPADT